MSFNEDFIYIGIILTFLAVGGYNRKIFVDHKFEELSKSVSKIFDLLIKRQAYVDQIGEISEAVKKVDSLATALYIKESEDSGPISVIKFNWIAQLSEFIIHGERMNMEEISQMAFDLEIYEELKFKTTGEAVRFVLGKMNRERKINKVVEWLKKNREDIIEDIVKSSI